MRQAIRRDLADVAEASHHFAPHYAQPLMCRATAPSALHAEPSDEAVVRAELVTGSGYALLDLNNGWAWGYAVDGHIVGYVRRERLERA